MAQPIGGNAKCPCGSGKKHKHCCQSKAFEFQQDESGTVRRVVSMSDDVVDMLADHVDQLRDKKGSELSPEDPLFPDFQMEHVEHGIVEAMKSSGVDPAIIHAFEQTGLLVSEENQHLISEADLAAWHQAVAEFREGSDATTLKFVAPDGSLCWSCDKPLPETAKRCPHCEAKVDDAPSAEDAAMLMELFQEMDPRMIDTMKQMVEESENGEDFLNRIMVGPCPTCDSDNTGDCEDDPEIDDPSIGRCFDCSQLFCCDCDELFKTDANAAAHNCPIWDEDEDVPF
ncbi:MAG: SEC-C metal-binding domain-containing protein [Pirellulaceae bacterium]